MQLIPPVPGRQIQTLTNGIAPFKHVNDLQQVIDANNAITISSAAILSFVYPIDGALMQ